jgi:hypothetical protein
MIVIVVKKQQDIIITTQSLNWFLQNIDEIISNIF